MKKLLASTLILASSTLVADPDYKTIVSPTLNGFYHKDEHIEFNVVAPGFHLRTTTPSNLIFDVEGITGPTKVIDVYHVDTQMTYVNKINEMIDISPSLSWKILWASDKLTNIQEQEREGLWYKEVCRRVSSIGPSIKFTFKLHDNFNFYIHPYWHREVLSNVYARSGTQFNGYFPEHNHIVGAKVGIYGLIDKNIMFSFQEHFCRSINGKVKENISTLKIGYCY